MSPASFRPVVLFADADESALHRILVRIEPLIISFSLRQWRPLRAYVERCKPEVLIVSDRFAGGQEKLRRVLSEIHGISSIPMLLLGEEPGPDVAEQWTEVGVSGQMLHPGRVESRIDAMLQRILKLAHDAGAA